MSLIRTGHTPGAWRDEGPARHVPRPGHGIRGNTVQGFVPFVVLPIVQSEAERSRQRRRSVQLRGERLAKTRPMCGAILITRQYGNRDEEPCARTPGHRWEHQSEARMEHIREQRKSRR